MKDQINDVFKKSITWNQVQIRKLKLGMLKLNWMDHACNNQPFHDYGKETSIVIFQLCIFRKFSLVPFVGIHTWKKGWRKRDVMIDLGNPIQHAQRDLVRSRKLSLLKWHFGLCIRTLQLPLVYNPGICSLRHFWIRRWHSLTHDTPFHFP